MAFVEVLDGAFFSFSNRFDTDKYRGRWGALYKSEQFQTGAPSKG